MSARIRYYCFLVVLIINTAAANDWRAGFVEINDVDSSDGEERVFGVWYPSSDDEVQQKWQSFNPTWAWEGAVAMPNKSAGFPIIIFSHGDRGQFYNHHTTAALLARAGYIVIAPQHRKDRTRPDVSVSARNEDMHAALQILKNYESLAAAANWNSIGALGYSLGGLTVLTSAGALPIMAKAIAHCDAHGGQDRRFCRAIKAPWWLRVVLWVRGQSLLAAADFKLDLVADAIDYKSIALVAPVGVGFSAEQLLDIRSERVAIFRFGRDQVLHYPYHAHYLYESLQTKNPHYVVYDNAHHHAFLTSSRVRAAADGFDRAAFIKKINAEILSFFKRTL